MKKPRKRFLKKYDGKKYGWFLLAKEFVIALLVLTVVFNVLVGVSRVTGQSMEPTLTEGQIVFFLRFPMDYQRGDVVMAQMPSGEYYVKRIAALPGDVVELEGGTLFINGEPLPHDQGQIQPEEGIVAYPYRVEEGKYFVLGDNSAHSTDSRSFGALPRSSIRGRLLFC